MSLIGILSIAIPLIIVLWQGYVSIRQPKARIKDSTVLVLTAHPDDECMFFGPTILDLANPKLNNSIILLCLSTGNHEGIGHLRSNELRASAAVLGIPASRTISLNHAELQDDPKRYWDKDIVSTELAKVVKQYKVDTLITFDEGGVSGHSNHISCLNGAKHYVSTTNAPPSLYKLETVTILRKYAFVLDLPLTVILQRGLLYISSPAGFIQARTAMTKHITQLVWFRYLYVLFSRYMVINELIKVDAKLQ